MTLGEFSELTDGFPDSLEIGVSKFGPKVSRPRIELLDAVQFEGESYSWIKNDNLKYDFPHVVKKVLRIS